MKRKFNTFIRNNGSVYVELLVAFFGWVILLSTVIPAFFHIQLERKNLLIEHEAREILAEQYIKWSLAEPIDRIKEGKYIPSYEITNQQEKNYPTICVTYQDVKNSPKQICQNQFR